MTTPIQSKPNTFIRRHRVPIITAAVAVVVGFGIGLAVVGIPYLNTMNANAVWDSAYQQLSAQQKQTQAELDGAKNREAALTQKENALAGRENAVTAREKAVGATEQKIKDNSFAGGVYVVGRDVKAGTYRTGPIAGTCYYVWKTGTGADANIVDNNIVKEGTATVTLRDGQTFESSRCGTWTRVDG